ALDARRAERAKREETFHEGASALAHDDGARVGQGLHARGEVHRVTDRRIFSLRFAGLDRPDHDLAGIRAGPDLNRRSAFVVTASDAPPDLGGTPQGGIERTLRVVFVRIRRAEQRKDDVTGRLHHVSVVAADGVDHETERGIDDGAGLLWIEILFERGGVYD